MKLRTTMSIFFLSAMIGSAHATRSGSLILSPNGGIISLFWTATSSSNATIAVSPSTRSVNEGTGGSAKTVSDVSATLGIVPDNGTATLSILWELQVAYPAQNGTLAPSSSSYVSYQLDEQQKCSAFAYCTRSSGAVYADASQDLTNASAYEIGFNYAPDYDDPGAVNGTISGTKNLSDWTLVGSTWYSGFVSIKTTNDSVSRTYVGNPNSDLFGGSGTTTLVNFNQSGSGFGGNSISISW